MSGQLESCWNSERQRCLEANSTEGGDYLGMDYIPFLVDLYITSSCNLRCIHCNADAVKKGTKLPVRRVFSLIDELYEIGTTNLAITGGEPFLHEQCLQIIKYACNKEGWLVSVNTNGTCLDKSLIEKLAADCKTVQLVISLDGHNPETYGILRRLPSGAPAESYFLIILKNIEYAIKHELNVTINYVLTKPTLLHFFQTAELVCKNWGLKLLGIKFFPHGRGLENYESLEIPYEQWHHFLVQVTKKAQEDKSFDELVQISVTCPWELYLPLLSEGYEKEIIERIWDYKSPLAWERYSASRNLGCDAGVTHCAINSDGYVTICGTVPTLKSLYVGNVLNRPFFDIWFNSEVLEKVRKQRLENIGPPCITCTQKGICGGGCRMRAFVLSGNLDGLDLACPIAKTYLQKRGRLNANYTRESRQ